MAMYTTLRSLSGKELAPIHEENWGDNMPNRERPSGRSETPTMETVGLRDMLITLHPILPTNIPTNTIRYCCALYMHTSRTLCWWHARSFGIGLYRAALSLPILVPSTSSYCHWAMVWWLYAHLRRLIIGQPSRHYRSALLVRIDIMLSLNGVDVGSEGVRIKQQNWVGCFLIKASDIILLILPRVIKLRKLKKTHYLVHFVAFHAWSER